MKKKQENTIFLPHQILISFFTYSVARKLGFSGESPYRFLAYQKRDGRLPRE
jgi:hypothetical protein